MGGSSEGRATIFLVEEDDDTRHILRENLQRAGYRVLVAVDEEDALERVTSGRVRADLVLVNLVDATDEEALAVGRRIRTCAEFDTRTPLVVMPEKYGKDVEGRDVNVRGSEWVMYLGEGPRQLESLLARLTSKMA